MRIETNTCTYKQDLTGNKQLATQVASRAETERNSAHNDVTVKDILGLHRLSHHYTGFTGGLRTWNPAPVLLVGQSAASKLLQRERPQQSTTVGNQPFTQRFINHTSGNNARVFKVHRKLNTTAHVLATQAFSS